MKQDENADKNLANCKIKLSGMIDKINISVAKCMSCPLYYHLTTNNPEQRSKNVIGMNAQKYIPECFVLFLDKINNFEDYRELIHENYTIFRNIFKNFGGLLKDVIKKDKEFTNFLLFVEQLGAVNFDFELDQQQTNQHKKINDNILGLFEEAFGFMKKFITEHILYDNIDEFHLEDNLKQYTNMLTLAENLYLSKSKACQQFSSKEGYDLLTILIDNFIKTIDEKFGQKLQNDTLKIRYTAISIKLIHI